jgi:phage terminase large subunit-like protein
MLDAASTSIFGRLAAAVGDDWAAKARPEQLPPPGDWTIWIYLAGRGAGKTRSGVEWVRSQIAAGVSRIALIAPTAADCRDVLVEGQSGILATSPEWDRPLWEPSKRRLTWSNGAIATLFSSEEPDRLRGPQFGAALCDEFAAWQNIQATWDMLQFGLRLGKRPRAMITTTPRPLKIIKNLIARAGQDVVLTRGKTADNAANLAPTFMNAIVSRYEGTRLGRQELDGAILDDVPGALWTREAIDATKAAKAIPGMVRIVVAIDPSGTAGADDSGDSIGIVVAGKGTDGRGYVLADRTCKLSPDGWGRRAVEAYHEFKADRIIAERNFGGAMVAHVIRTVDPNVSYREVVASRGKVARAEPIAALYEQRRITHVTPFPDLEDQMCSMAGDGYCGDGSPDRVDALVWALSDLIMSSAGPLIVTELRI